MSRIARTDGSHQQKKHLGKITSVLCFHHSPIYAVTQVSSNVRPTDDFSANILPDISVARFRTNGTAVIVTLPREAPLPSFAVTVTSDIQAVAEENEKMLADSCPVVPA